MPIKVSGSIDCNSMDNVKNKDSLTIFLYSNKYILTTKDCVARYAIAEQLPNSIY